MPQPTKTDPKQKLQRLREIIDDCGSMVIAFSGGLDSTFLLKVAVDALGDRAIAVTARSSTYPEREYEEAVRLAQEIGARHITFSSEELEIENFRQSPPRRCYFCKKELFSKLTQIAQKEGINRIADGANADDVHDFRPGMEAAGELGVISPLKEASLTKEDIRALSKEMGLSTWDKPSFACLASRFPYGEEITVEKLKMVSQAEDFLRGLGFRQLRVRHHSDIARIEVSENDIPAIIESGTRRKIISAFKDIGYNYVTVDLAGYRTGSMNIPLKINKQ